MTERGGLDELAERTVYDGANMCTHVLGGLSAADMSNLSLRSACAILSSNNFRAILSSLVRPVHLHLQLCGGDLILEADRRSIPVREWPGLVILHVGGPHARDDEVQTECVTWSEDDQKRNSFFGHHYITFPQPDTTDDGHSGFGHQNDTIACPSSKPNLHWKF